MIARNYAKRLELYKSSIVGKTIYWLTCVDVIYDNGRYIAKCICKCGNGKDIDACRFAKCNIIKSCGCYKHSREFSESQRQYILDRPEIIENSVRKTKEWHNNNPDKVKERNQKVSNWYKEHPDKVKDKEDKHRQWFKDNSDIFEEQCERQRQYYRDNPSKRKEISDRQKKYYSEHPEKCDDEIREYISTFYKETPIQNSRNIISPLELDLYYPEKKIAVEFNGDYWHSDEFKSNDYHYNKFKICYSMGITLISIFENKWNCDREDIKMYLFDVFNDKTNDLSFRKAGYMDNNYHARCNLSSIMCSDYYMFKNHRVYTCGYTKIEN